VEDAARIADAGPPDAGAADAGPPSDAGPPTCATLDCDDGLDCTEDSCAEGVCAHMANHARCPESAFCSAERGCVGGEACFEDADCVASPGGCVGPAVCDVATRRCRYDVLDGDLDGHGPPVCGGADCDDA